VEINDFMTIERIDLTGVPREEWLERRRAFINASETAIVVGEAQWGSLAELYAEKKGLRPPRKDMSGVLRRGNWGESSVFDALAETYPQWEVSPTKSKLHIVDREKRQACTPDGFAHAPGRPGIGVVQAKVVARNVFRNKWLEDPEESIQYGAATPPPAYRIQTLHEMMLNETSWGVLAVLINGEHTWDFRLFDVERNPIIEDRIDYRIADFFERYLDPEIMPPFEPLRDEELVKELYPRDHGTAIDLTGDNRALALVEDLIQHQAAEKRAKHEIKIIKTELQAKLGEHTYGVLPNGHCLQWKVEHRRAYTVEAQDNRVFRLLKKTPETANGD
jgi:predicted phage-related endonuclease